MDNAEAIREASERRRAAAAQYRPNRIHLLLVAESPPARLSRYFYFDDVEHHDGLFWNVVKGVLGVIMTDRSEKPKYLRELQLRGVYMIDLKEDPSDETPCERLVDGLIERCRELRPEKIILVESNIFDMAYIAMHNAGLPVINRRIPFPTNNNHLKFASVFAQALKQPPPAPPGVADFHDVGLPGGP